jgi:hypothetical protein
MVREFSSGDKRYIGAAINQHTPYIPVLLPLTRQLVFNSVSTVCAHAGLFFVDAIYSFFNN